MTKKIQINYRAEPTVFDEAKLKASSLMPAMLEVNEDGDSFSLTLTPAALTPFEKFEGMMLTLPILPRLAKQIDASFDKSEGPIFAQADLVVVHVAKDTKAKHVESDFDDDQLLITMIFHPGAHCFHPNAH
ncbi:hypothetical protein AB4874_16055 [Thioclava sp. 15-R06ZXC-3]|uniref:Uncharacterized protein n=1 Tax=Thioclava arctica TaxID=3238301 RepID=A0ABV3TPJ0_9RHOB